MKLYQIVSASDGTRSEVFSCESLQQLALHLKNPVEADASFGNHYVLVLVEDADGKPFASRAPMMRVSSIVEMFGAE